MYKIVNRSQLYPSLASSNEKESEGMIFNQYKKSQTGKVKQTLT